MGANERRGLVIAAVVITALASAPVARGAGLDPRILTLPAVERLHRLGLVLVGDQDVPRTRAAVALARASLEGAGHAVVTLPGTPNDPPRPLVLNYCATSDLDAVVIVKVSTAPGGWRADVELRDSHNRPLPLAATRLVETTGATNTGSRSFALVPETSTVMSGPEPTAEQDAQLRQAQEDDQDDQPRAPRLHLDSDRQTFLGGTPIGHDELYEIVGRPDLASRYVKRSRWIRAGKVLGWVTVGAGIATAGVLAAAVEFQVGTCLALSCAKDDGVAVPGANRLALATVALGAVGTGMLIAMGLVRPDPLTLEERRRLARDYNARLDGTDHERAEQPPAAGWLRDLAVAGGPLPNGDGGALLLSGRF